MTDQVQELTKIEMDAVSAGNAEWTGIWSGPWWKEPWWDVNGTKSPLELP